MTDGTDDVVDRSGGEDGNRPVPDEMAEIIARGADPVGLGRQTPVEGWPERGAA